MKFGFGLGALSALTLAMVVWTLIAGRMERWNISAPMWFVAVGWLVTNGPGHLVSLSLHSEAIKLIAEFALAVVLFGDAARVKLRDLGHDAGLPSRLLLGGLPLTIALGTVAAHLLLPSLSWWVCAVIGAAVAPTDAALGAAIIDDERVPERIRRVLNVESGLNDGIATPFVKFFLVAAAVGTSLEQGSERHAIGALLLGVAGGIVIGGVGGALMEQARRHGWSSSAARPVGVLALAVLSYAAVVKLDGNGFVAAFIAGLAYGATTSAADDEPLQLTHQTGGYLASVVWFIFGAVMLPQLHYLTWRDVIFAIAALTVVRMLPVALSLIGAGFDRSTIAVIGWFGPRGLASVVFALMAVEALEGPIAQRVDVAITATVTLSVLLHGMSAAPIAARYAASHPSINDENAAPAV
jgi:NhaP-type Na+/H+ or K+/H+ antiporter